MINLIVGLGNPGEEYENTRHNAGVWFVTALASQSRTTLRPNSKLYGLHGIAKLHGHECHLLIPTVYMNQSGQPVQAISHYYKMTPSTTLIAHDDIDLPPGDIRLKFDGGHGGHNGLKDIMSHLGTPQFYRLRIGVGRPHPSKEVVDYVLHPPKKTEYEQIENALEKAYGIVPLLLEGHFQKAMQQLHTEQR